MRSMRRGIKEMDLILSAFAEAQLPRMTAAELATYEAMLDQSDLDIYRWVSGQDVPPAEFAPLVGQISKLAVGLTSPRGV
ncbi:succinate dehydrogenase assembly factor 2 [Salipiger sp. IMCC34102]|nr:succinate dehydrogenase assembly factor 2 [Salipiger sp. IMCC34102]